MRRKKVNKGAIAIAFGVGFILACCCPSGLTIAVLAIAVIIMGISLMCS